MLGLLLLVPGRLMLIKTITSFTVAHSITLAIATLGYASAPLPPLNVAIALSIFYLGPEIIRQQRGKTSLTIRHPWLIAFVFGLLHGFSFASGLTSLGLPHTDIPFALLMFNLGVEFGQLGFVFLVLALVHSFNRLEIVWPRWVAALPCYTVGSLGAILDHSTRRDPVPIITMKTSSSSIGWRVTATVIVTILFFTSPAEAHIQRGAAAGFKTAFRHPWSGWDHILAMVAVGIWGVQLGQS